MPKMLMIIGGMNMTSDDPYAQYAEDPYAKYEHSEDKTTAEKTPKKEEKESGLWNTFKDYEKSLGLGLAQGAGNASASILNWPIQGIEHLSGKKLPHVPHPDFINEYYPDSKAGNIGKGIGNFIGGVAVPVGGPVKTGYNALRAVPGIKG